MSSADSATTVARDYYNSSDADRFYAEVWGGEDIHVGMYQSGDEAIIDASHRTVQYLGNRLGTIGPESRVLDIGSGYGGAARYLAKTFGCHVTCLNLSDVENERNRHLTDQAGCPTGLMSSTVVSNRFLARTPASILFGRRTRFCILEIGSRFFEKSTGCSGQTASS